jgi:AraC-like DNA-binding protein
VQEYFNIITYIFIIGAAQGLMLSIFLSRKKENRSANRLLSVLMLIFAIDLLIGIYIITGAYLEDPTFIGISQALPYLYGPGIFLYVYLLSHKKDGFRKTYWLHAIPFLLVQLYGLFFFYFEPMEYKILICTNTDQQPWHLAIIGDLIPLHGCTYVFFTIREVLRYNRRLKESYSNIDKINLNWLLYITSGTALIWVIVILSYTLNFIYGDDLQANVFIYISLSVFLYTFGFKSLRQPETIILEEGVIQNIEDKNQVSYKKSGLADEKAEEMHQKLLHLMNTEKPFLDNKLSLSQLSERLNISTHNLSEVINRKQNQNFYDFINKYRVEEVQRLLQEDKQAAFSILAIGFDAGFSSKSAFYTAFKKITGETPAQYRENIKLKKAV